MLTAGAVIIMAMSNKIIITLEAKTDQHGNLLLPDLARLPAGQRVLITLLEPEIKPSVSSQIDDITLLSEPALDDWNRPEEDLAWSHLQPAQ
jgi:hypothetical protein